MNRRDLAERAETLEHIVEVTREQRNRALKLKRWNESKRAARAHREAQNRLAMVRQQLARYG